MTEEMKKVYISRNYKDTNSAGNKAKTDVEKVLDEGGYINIGYRQTHYKNSVAGYFINLLGILKACILMPREGVLFLQYPLKKYFSLLCKVAHSRNTKVIALMHDLGSFRRKRLTPKHEVDRVSNADYFISANPQTIDWLVENQYMKKTNVHHIFDYLSDSKNPSGLLQAKRDRYVVNYAGALSQKKNSFLYQYCKMIQTYTLHLYGSGFDVTQVDATNLVYKGFKPSDEVIRTVEGDFGLVWDGDSVDTCSGDYGVYLKYNNPHKVSFYIRCHLPIFIWRGAGIASFVEENKIGFTIDSLSEIEGILRNITLEEYNQLKQNTIDVSERLRVGFYIREAERKAIESLIGKE